MTTWLCIFCSSSLGGGFLLRNVAVNADPSETRVPYERLLINSYSSWFFSLVDTFLFIRLLLSQTESMVCHSWKDFWSALVCGNLFIGYLQVNHQMDFLLTLLPHGFNYGWEKYIQEFYGKTWSRETTGKTRHRWEDHIKVNLKTAGWDGMDWMHVAVNSTVPLWPW